ncbi:hypothetical protein GLAREA_00953 [Glarea lozoyensis ATCC 20868]|uniref:Uncharacterized protein n=1 Tax=Glarea lozoyensis (strain ATCC 20868 / MF5171) TaxID=1116229 RepID=S3DTU3_GLAL2|nr:uncharacterized protein GLAREA_00953 [Glarea lozoyensis ATCC 20868]EPE29793.1 hypothetical protein GLAREA_00953 [Glarea lozoyensis ATCC 20868]
MHPSTKTQPSPSSHQPITLGKKKITPRKEPLQRYRYVQPRNRIEEIQERYGRKPSPNELRAIDSLPTVPVTELADKSPVGLRIHYLLTQSEDRRDVSLLEEAGRLIWQQIFEPERCGEVRVSGRMKYIGPFEKSKTSQDRRGVADVRNGNTMVTNAGSQASTNTAESRIVGNTMAQGQFTPSTVTSQKPTFQNTSHKPTHSHTTQHPPRPQTTTSKPFTFIRSFQPPPQTAPLSQITLATCDNRQNDHPSASTAPKQTPFRNTQQVAQYSLAVLTFLNRESDLEELQVRSRALVSGYLDPSAAQKDKLDEFLMKCHGGSGM